MCILTLEKRKDIRNPVIKSLSTCEFPEPVEEGAASSSIQFVASIISTQLR